MIRPFPGPPPVSAFVLEPSPPAPVHTLGGVGERPEEPAKYIFELPKLTPPELSHSAVTCGNWLAQVRQVFQGLSPSATVWWASVEQAANFQYQRWLLADPLDRLLLDPATVVATFDAGRYQRVESRAVTLILAAIPTNLRDEAVSNRWLSSSALLFRLQCVYQPGGSSERSMLLSQLVAPETMKSCAGAVQALRKWQQSFNRVQELHAALPDSSLLLKGIDGATSSLFSQYPAVSFRVSSFRNRASLDYNPSVGTVLQLARLLQAEFESASLTMEVGHSDKRPRNAAAQLSGPVEPPRAPHPKIPPPPPPVDLAAKALEFGGESKGKGKGKEKGKEGLGLCHNFTEAKGCKYGDACKFVHDRASARKQKRCLACGAEGHCRPECPNVPLEHRPVAASEGSGGSGQLHKAPGPKKPPLAKAKSGPVVKGVTEDSSAVVGGPGSSSEASSQVQETLLAEAAKLLKGVSLKVCRAPQKDLAAETGSHGLDLGWLVGAVGASDHAFALVDSGATNALRQAKEGELSAARVIQVDLASGAAELHIGPHGTLLSVGPCQVILPAGYLVQLGYTISWRPKGCVIQRLPGFPDRKLEFG